MDTQVMFQISYGLFILTAREGEKDNGCIINTLQQVTDSPLRVAVTVNKRNYTHDLIRRTGIFNVSILSQEASFETFRHFGFQSGRDVNKMKDYMGLRRDANGVMYLQSRDTNGYLSAKVFDTVDLGTHTMFLADVTGGEKFSDVPSCTYSYYQSHIKPKPQEKKGQTGWRCIICGYIYEGEELPADFVCPICKHGVADFEKIEPVTKHEEEKTMKYVCQVCGYVYDEALGDPDNGIAAGTKWEDLPEDFVCPLCGVGKDQFAAE